MTLMHRLNYDYLRLQLACIPVHNAIGRQTRALEPTNLNPSEQENVHCVSTYEGLYKFDIKINEG